MAGQYTVALLVDQHELTRRADSVASQAGAGEVCRGSNFGLPMVQTKTMQVCTRQQAREALDPAVPLAQPQTAYGQEQWRGAVV